MGGANTTTGNKPNQLLLVKRSQNRFSKLNFSFSDSFHYRVFKF